MERLKVIDNKRFLCTESGKPFFWLADTGWELFHRLNTEQAETYFQKRQEQQFNVVQAVILAEHDGLNTPNAYGRVPLCKNSAGQYDPTMPDLNGEYNYFDHVDVLIDMAEQHGIYVALVPTWGDKWNLKWGIGPQIFTPENAYTYGKFIGERYKNRDNIVWVMGGDRSIDDNEQLLIVRNMANGIKDGGANQIMTFHPCGGKSSSEYVNDENWLDFNMLQSGHWEHIANNYNMIEKDYNIKPVRPALDGECNYEDHPIQFDPKNGYFDDTDVRRASYYAVFSGSFGITYGHHSVWAMIPDDEPSSLNSGDKRFYFAMPWLDALDRPAANQMKHLKNLMLSRSFFDRVPCQQIILNNPEGALHQQATRGDKYIFVYCPCGLPCELDMSGIKGFLASWFDVRTGETAPIGKYCGGKNMMFIPQNHGRREDCVLIIDID